MTYTYETCCIHSTAEAINNMVDQARDITWETFRSHVHWTDVRRVFPYYSYGGEMFSPINGELTSYYHIKDDWAVGFHKSKYKGIPCYYIQHSGDRKSVV